MSRLLALDLSTSTGWASFEDGVLKDYGLLDKVFIQDFNVNAHPNNSPLYPGNIMEAARQVASLVAEKIEEVKPDGIVIENSTKGRNRHTQRLIEWVHFTVLELLASRNLPFSYLDPSQWRKILDIRMSNEDRKNNKEVNAGRKRGKVNKKHLAIRYCNEKYSLNLLVKHDDIADAICLGEAFLKASQ